ncbi:MAG: 1-acyl-sn-glycerol-3-phosphate acyltransferase [Anaerolineae bacterium]|nr:1-acyl-sn-glycerol-3-phosphate acyltransferase [Anaerolineae bacterium]MCB9132095.1 1-acyl-sn-glycerol-3-phosphate acyltransferase [Anaerolineales bacterium]MCB9143168.1 1-acyl-sn-glycerol-3-phosphate acyltransferase [Anaerolineales bacterium]
MMASNTTIPRRVRFLQSLAHLILWLFTRFEVHGAEKIPESGPTILTMNHLHFLDPVIGISIVNRHSKMFTADKWETRPVIGNMIVWSQQAIFVARGEVDRKALAKAIEALKEGLLLGVAPEGTRSKTGTLQKGHEGVAYLASRTGAVIVPAVAYGQEKAIRSLLRLRRGRIVVNIGEPYVLPGTPNKAKTEELGRYTDQIMMRMAVLLPPEYQGYYRERVAALDAADDPMIA